MPHQSDLNIKASLPSSNTTETAAVRPPARTHAQRAPDGRTHSEDAKGTPPSNTVPSNDNTDKFKPLRFGVDSLYLSYHGQLADEWNIKLDDLKTKAQSEDEAEQALAQVSIGSHIFEVRDKGMPRFPYVLVDNRYGWQFACAPVCSLGAGTVRPALQGHR